jgi:hypothetical protein
MPTLFCVRFPWRSRTYVVGSAITSGKIFLSSGVDMTIG